MNGANVARKGLMFYTMTVMVALAMISKAEAQSTTAPQNTASSTEGTSQVKAEDVKADKKTKKLGVIAILEGSTNLRTSNDLNSSRETAYLLYPSYQVTDSVKLGAQVAFIQDLKNSQESDFRNTVLSASYKPIDIVKEQLTITPSVTGLLPTNKESRKTTSLMGGVGLSQALVFDMKKLHVPASITYFASARRNIHEFTRNNEGSYNTEYSVTNMLKADVEIVEKLSFIVMGSLLSGLTYSERWSSSFDLLEKIEYQVSDAVFVALGHDNTGSTLKSNMNDSNVEVFNQNSSTVFLDVGIVY